MSGRAGWLARREDRPLQRVALAPLVAFSRVYATGARLKRFAYESGWLSQSRLPCAVIAVGSPLAGGTGKTPLGAWLAAALRDRGRRVAIASQATRSRRRASNAVVT